MHQTKSLYKGSHFSRTEIEIRAAFGPVGNNEKIILDDFEQLLTKVKYPLLLNMPSKKNLQNY